MNTIINHKKSLIAAVGSAVAAAAVPAFLFASAGTAQATTQVTATPWGATGVTVHVKSTGIIKIMPREYLEDGNKELNPATLSSGDCSYSAVPQPGGTGEPVTNIPFTLQPGGTANIPFPLAKPTGSTWNITIHCNEGLDSPTTLTPDFKHLVY